MTGSKTEGAAMRRREFITLFGGAIAWPLAARAQQDERMRRIGILMPFAEDDDAKARLAVFTKALESLGWTAGRNLQIDVRWTGFDDNRLRSYVSELVATAPDVILTETNRAVSALRQSTGTVPIVFVLAIDPVGAGNVTSLARPGGNATGFLLFEYSISGKWLELLKQIAPGVTRVAVLRDPNIASGIGQFAAIQAVAPPFNVELIPIDIRDGDEIERAITTFAREPNGGLIVTASVTVPPHRKLISTLAARYRLPSVHPFRSRVADAHGLISYGPDLVDQHRAGATYVDRILKGEKPADLPVQAPTKYELVINLKTAKALGLTVPMSLLGRADEVIE
jgi:ABC-type uncharacterized transport system substrate-binding protein